VLSLALFALQDVYFVYLASFTVHGLVAVSVYALCLRPGRAVRPRLTVLPGGRSAVEVAQPLAAARPRAAPASPPSPALAASPDLQPGRPQPTGPIAAASTPYPLASETSQT
jgi:hypothetical protein